MVKDLNLGVHDQNSRAISVPYLRYHLNLFELLVSLLLNEETLWKKEPLLHRAVNVWHFVCSWYSLKVDGVVLPSYGPGI